VNEDSTEVVGVFLDPVVEHFDLLLVEESQDVLLQRARPLAGDDLHERSLLRDGFVDHRAQCSVDVLASVVDIVEIQLELHRSIVRPAVNDSAGGLAWHDTTMPTLADADVVRRLYQAFAGGDLVALESCFAEDVVWHLPGKSAVSGDHHGWPQIRDNFMAKLGPLSGGTLRVELVDVAIGDVFVVAVQHATASSGGKTLDVTACQLITVRDGLIHEVRGHYSDQEALDAILR